jgi:rRNA maturation endonuclease Nob1
MILSPLTVVLLLLPGVLVLGLIVLIALPRALRDEARLKHRRCLKCGAELKAEDETCPACGHNNAKRPLA